MKEQSPISPTQDLRNQRNQRERERAMGTSSPATTPATTQAYGEAWYWDNRYANDSGPFDWYQKYSSLSPIINLYIPRHRSRILVVGCGNSAFSEDMADDGYGDVVSVDISSVVIEAMKRKHCNRPHLKYLLMDVREMGDFDSGSFDAVVDKGTLDSLLCGSNSHQMASKMLEEVGRVLKDKGVYVLITYGAPVYRTCLLRNSYSWTIQLHVIEKVVGEDGPEHPIWELTKPVPVDENGNFVDALAGKHSDVHYIYVCTKDDNME